MPHGKAGPRPNVAAPLDEVRDGGASIERHVPIVELVGDTRRLQERLGVGVVPDELAVSVRVGDEVQVL